MTSESNLGHGNVEKRHRVGRGGQQVSKMQRSFLSTPAQAPEAYCTVDNMLGNFCCNLYPKTNLCRDPTSHGSDLDTQHTARDAKPRSSFLWLPSNLICTGSQHNETIGLAAISGPAAHCWLQDCHFRPKRMKELEQIVLYHIDSAGRT